MKKVVIVFLIIVSLIVGYFGGNYIFKEDKNDIKCVEVEENTTIDNSMNSMSNKELNILGMKLTNPFITLGNLGEGTTNFFQQKEYTFDTIDNEVKLNVIYYRYNSENDNQNKSTSSIVEEDERWYFHDILLSDLDKYTKIVFGEDKKINYPSSFNLQNQFESYELKNNKYVLSANGGGYMQYTDEIIPKIVSVEQSDNKIIVIVDFVYKAYDKNSIDENLDNESNITSTIYEGYNKKKVLEKNVHTYEEDKIDELLWSDKTNYYVYTFSKENNNYILDNIKLVER